MFEFFANTFGYVLNFIYDIVCNYGWAIILFTILVKIVLLPISIKQQKTMKKSAKLQAEVKNIQFKYKNDPQKMNSEIMSLYKSEKMSPLSGCLSTIIQVILLLSIFYLVRSPLTFMRKIPAETINSYISQIQEQKEDKVEQGEKVEKEQQVEKTENVENVEQIQQVESAENAENVEQNQQVENVNKEEKEKKEEGKDLLRGYPEISVIKIMGEEHPEVNINMNFLGLDLSEVPQQNMSDFKVYIIPVLYIISSFISMKLTTAMQKKQTSNKKTDVIDITEPKEGEEGKEKTEQPENQVDMSMQTGKMMTWLVPIMSISIAFIAPLGLALYWLVNNVLMIVERLILNKVIKDED